MGKFYRSNVAEHLLENKKLVTKENSKFEKYCGKGANMSSWGKLCKH